MKNNRSSKLQGLSLVGISLSFVFTYFFPISFIESFISIFIFIFIIWSLPALEGSLKYITYGLLILAVILFVTEKASIHDWLHGIRVNLTLVAIFTFVPLLGIPVRLGGFLESLKVVFQRLNPKSSIVFIMTQTLTHLLAVVLNIGSITIVHYLSKAAPIQTPRLIVSAVNRGFISVIFWSPYFAAMAVVLSLLPISWGAILPYSLGFVFISFVVSIAVDWKLLKSEDTSFAIEVSATNENIDSVQTSVKKKLFQLFLLLFLMMATVLGIEFFTNLSMVIIICLAALLFPLIWSLFNRKMSGYLEEIKNHIFITMPRMKKEVVLFFVSGFFSAAFVHTNVSSTIITGVNEFFGGFTIGIAYCIVLAVVLTSIVGLHPIVPITILAASFDPQLLGFNIEYYAVLLLAAWGISNSISPATASNNLLANLWEIEVTNVSLRWNVKYGIILALVLPIYLEVINI